MSSAASQILARLGIAADYADAKKVKRQVVSSHYHWATPSTKAGGMVTNRAERGDIIEVTEAEAERGEALGALATEAGYEAALALQPGAAPPVAAGGVSDDELAAMNVKDTVDHLALHPGDRARIAALENDREKPRVGVLEVLERPSDEDREAAGVDNADGV